MIKVLIVDDSVVVRANLAHILTSDPGIQVIGSVSGGQAALDFVALQKPDVITMDIHMPDMDGYDAARRIMESIPVPIIVVSATWDPTQQEKSFKALEAGAVACMAKPHGIGHPDYAGTAAELIATVKQMSEVKVIRRWPKRPVAAVPAARVSLAAKQEIRIVALGASTGGPPAIQEFLAQLPKDFPAPILVVQHIARGFTRGFVDWLNASSPLPVYLAAHHETLWNGRVYVAPDELQMGIEGANRIVLVNDPPEHHLRPSAAYLFRSVARIYRDAAVGILLTGMGTDGSAELKLIKDAGGITFAQDKASSIVYGMPGEAVRLGACDHILPPSAIGATLAGLVTSREPSQGRESNGE
jgi:two-component system chemotaxis response regulator CheB